MANVRGNSENHSNLGILHLGRQEPSHSWARSYRQGIFAAYNALRSHRLVTDWRLSGHVLRLDGCEPAFGCGHGEQQGREEESNEQALQREYGPGPGMANLFILFPYPSMEHADDFFFVVGGERGTDPKTQIILPSSKIKNVRTGWHVT